MVTVTVSRLGSSGVSTFFANIIGIKAVDVQTKATAQVSKRATGTFCVRPFWLPNDVLGSCTKGQELFDSNGDPTPYAVSQLGSQISLWYKVAPSQWSLWDPSPYGTDFSTAMQSCINAAGGNVPVKCGDTLTTDNGAKVGQVLPAVQNLLGPNPDTYIAIGQYQDGVTGQIKDTSPQLASVAIWDTCTKPITPGKQTFPVSGWATMFIEGVGGPSSKTITARLISFSACASGGTPGTGPQAVPVRLVQTP
ncbi:MAG: hypothetical protein JOY79_03740 [Acidobacteriaceae bacterium]|nr:hypothetical protein [Acidobacteriaceae bacterium]